MSIKVEDLSRHELEEAVLKQCQQLHTQQTIIKSLEAKVKKAEDDYEELAGVVMAVRKLVSL